MNDVTKIENNDFMSKYQKTENIVEDVRNIIEVSQKEAYRAVNTILSQRNWLIGYRIAEEELAGEGRAEYGVEIIKRLSRELTDKYGKGYDRSNLYHCLRFYKAFPGIVDNPISGFLGHITELYCRYMMRSHANGMRRKHTSRPGVCVHYREI